MTLMVPTPTVLGVLFIETQHMHHDHYSVCGNMWVVALCALWFFSFSGFNTRWTVNGVCVCVCVCVGVCACVCV